MPIPSGVDQKKSKVYIQKTSGEYVQIWPESFCEGEILADSMWPVSSHALKQYSDNVEERIAPFAGATPTKVGKIGTVPQAEIGDRNSFLRGDGTWTKIAITDDKVKCILNKEKQFYLLGTEIADTNTGQATFDTGIFATENRGELQATHFIGDLTGNVVGDLEGTAKRAKFDADGNEISTFYAKDAQLADYAALVHQHSAGDIVSLSGYVKGNSTAEITEDNTLNEALGKLEHRLDISATLESPQLTGIPTSPTPGSNSSSDQIANKEYVDNKISDLIGGAGSALDTLKEIESALGNDPNFAATMTTKLGTKLDKNSANYVKTLSISDNTAGTGQILKVQRGDDTSYVLNIKDTVIQPATAAPKIAAASAAVGTSLKYAREDHVHPLQTYMQATPSGTSWVAGATAGKALVNATTTNFGALLNAPTKSYRVGLSTYPSSNDLVYLYSVSNANVNAGTNTTAKALTWNAATGELSADSFKGNISGASTSCTGNAATATTASKLGTATVGGTAKPIYLNGGTATAISATVGSASKPVFLSGGTITACSSTVGSTTKPVYMSGGAITASNATVGNANRPVYMNGGVLTACSKDITSGTYSNFTYSTKSAAGKAGLVPAPPKWKAQQVDHIDEWSHWTETVYIKYTLTGTGWATGASSDKRLKCNFAKMSDKLLDAWEDIDWCCYNFKRDCEEFGDHARIFSGLVVQDLHETLQKHGVNPHMYGLTIHDLRDPIPAEYNEYGELISEEQPAVDVWTLDYDNAFSIEAAYTRREMKRMAQEIENLKKELAELKSK